MSPCDGAAAPRRRGLTWPGDGSAQAHRDAAQADDDLVFADPITGGPLSKAANNRRFRKAPKAAQLDPTHRIHDLRHTFGTRCAAAGVPMRTLQEWIGHRDIPTTQRYADYAPSAREAELIAAAFGSTVASAGAATVGP